MPRSFGRKSHRLHKSCARGVTERSDSEDDGSSENRKLRLVEVGRGSGSGARVLRDADVEKGKASSSWQVSLENDRGGSKNEDLSSGRKRKDRVDSARPDRQNGSGKDNGFPKKSSKEEDYHREFAQKLDKSKYLTVESKSSLNRTRDVSSDRYVESGNKIEPLNRRSEKEHTRREYKEDKERDLDRHSKKEKDRGCGSVRGKKTQDWSYGRSDESESKSHRSRRTLIEVELIDKKDSTENARAEKDPENFLKKRRKGLDDRRFSSIDDHNKNESHTIEGHKDERYKDERYHDRYYKELDRGQRDQRHRDICRREEPSYRDDISHQFSSTSVRHRGKHVESNNKIKLHESERELSPLADDRRTKMRDNNRLRKRSYDEVDDRYGLGKISMKKSRSNIDKEASDSSKFDDGHRGKVESSLNHSPSRSFLSSKTHSPEEQIRRGLKRANFTHREPVRDDRACPTDDHDRISAVHERFSDSLSSEKPQPRDRVNSVSRERQLVSNSLTMENNFLTDLQTSEHASGSPPLFKRTARRPPKPPMRHGTNNSSPYEDEKRVTSGNHKSNSRYRRSSDPNIERGSGGAWNNGPNWPAPFPFHHGAPTSAFTMPHFSPQFYSARKYMEINHASFPYQMQEKMNQFPGYIPQFGWQHPAGNSWLPQINGLDGGSSLYPGLNWNWNSHPIHGQSSELNIEMSKDSNKADHQKLTDDSRFPPNAAAHGKNLNDSSNKQSMKAFLKSKFESGSSIPTKSYGGDGHNLGSYLSKIDISADLTQPELYKELTDILAYGNFVGSTNTSKDEDAKNNRIEIYKKLQVPKSSLLPIAAEASFKRAMSVYEKLKCTRHLKSPPPPPPLASSCSKALDISLKPPVEEPPTVNDNSAPNLAREEGERSINGDADVSPALMKVENIESPHLDVLENSQI